MKNIPNQQVCTTLKWKLILHCLKYKLVESYFAVIFLIRSQFSLIIIHWHSYPVLQCVIKWCLNQLDIPNVLYMHRSCEYIYFYGSNRMNS